MSQRAATAMRNRWATCPVCMKSRLGHYAVAVIVEHYDSERVRNPNPRGETTLDEFHGVREDLFAACRRYGAVGPDNDDCKMYLCDDQYNDELYHYVEIYDRSILSAQWVRAIMKTLGRHSGWGVGIKNLRFSYLLIFSKKLMVTGWPFADCNTIEAVASAAASNLW